MAYLQTQKHTAQQTIGSLILNLYGMFFAELIKGLRFALANSHIFTSSVRNISISA